MQIDYSVSIVIEYNIIAHLLELILIAVHDSDSQNELLCVVIIENAVQVISKTFQEKTQSVIWGKPALFSVKSAE